MNKARKIIDFVESIERDHKRQKNPKPRTIGRIGSKSLRLLKLALGHAFLLIPDNFGEKKAVTLAREIDSVLSKSLGNKSKKGLILLIVL